MICVFAVHSLYFNKLFLFSLGIAEINRIQNLNTDKVKNVFVNYIQLDKYMIICLNGKENEVRINFRRKLHLQLEIKDPLLPSELNFLT